MYDVIFWRGTYIGDSLENNSKSVTFTKSYYFPTSIKIPSINLTLNVNIWENQKFLKV